MRNILILLLIIASTFVFLRAYNSRDNQSNNLKGDSNNKISHVNDGELSIAHFAGGCFWCMEGIFESQDGVVEAIAGYAGGTQETANYDDVSTGTTEHREAVRIVYDASTINFEKLVDLFWTQIDPTDAGGQFTDRGFQYTTAIYYYNEQEKQIAENSKEQLENSGKFDKPIMTKILPFKSFFEAEEYHQDYYKKSSTRYKNYKEGSGRKGFIDENWSDEIDKINKSDNQDLKEKLSETQYKVTQENGTEKPFDNEYRNNHEKGIYVDVVDGTPLFLSTDKYDSGTGWPSFTKPLDSSMIEEKNDMSLLMERTEVRSKNADSHLGHVFEDGPTKEGGMRYCINSAALKFIPYDEMEENGYGEYKKLLN